MDATVGAHDLITKVNAMRRFRARKLSDQEVAAVLNRLRELWEGGAEAPAVRSAVGDFADAFRAKDPAFDVEAFWVACGYEVSL